MPCSSRSGTPTLLQGLCSALHAQTAARDLARGQQLHAHILKYGVQATPSVTNHLINFYSKCQLPHSSHLVFRECPYGLPSTATFSSLISSFAQNHLPYLALLFLLRMVRAGLRPDNHALPSAAKACGMLSDLLLGGCVHSLVVKTGFDSDVYVGSSLVDMYAKCEFINESRKVFDRMPERNVVTWTGMIYGYSQLGLVEEVMVLFKRMLEGDDDGDVDFGLCVNDFTYSSVIRVCSDVTLLELGRQVHCHCTKTSFNSSPFVGGSLIALYSKCGVVENAYKVFEEMPAKNLGVWNAMLFSCAQHGHPESAFRHFDDMLTSGLKPNFITFLHLLYACSHAGLVEKGKWYFDLMVNRYSMDAGLQHYTCMVDLLSRAGRLEEAMEFISQMPIDPTDTVWAALLTGCRIHNDIGMATYAAERLRKTNSQSSGPVMLLCNAYTASGKLEAAADARKALRDKGVKKETGVSWVELGNQIHRFVSGDQWHERSEAIYRKLGEMEEEMVQMGYAVNTRKVDVEERKRTARWHSERLAAAWWLVAVVQKERPMRVMKNLRVCEDCHTWFKFLTMCTGRIAILRDNTRFHRFENGLCSCGDYW